MVTGRAKGKHNPRMGEGADRTTQGVSPDSPIGRELGISDRVQGSPSPIPGGKNHIQNAQSFQQRVPAPAPADFTDQPVDNAHGVYDGTHLGFSRAQLTQGRLASRQVPDQYYTPTAAPPRPIPVYVVETEDRSPTYRSAAPRNIPVPVVTSAPVPICGRDPKRVELLLLNESATTLRIGQTYTDVNSGGGALLPASMGGYLRLRTQDTLYAISTSSTAATLSVIQVFDTEGTGL
jgi:hypothetical protein